MTVVTVIDGDKKTPSPKDSDVETLLEKAQMQFSTAKEASADDRAERLTDLKFRSGDQWPDAIKQDRDNDSRPALTINQLPHFIRLVTNDMRQNRASITVSATDEDATEATALVLQGLIRHIEYDSNADYAYNTAGDAQATHGLGFLRVVTQYEDPLSFDQVIKIKRIKNSFSVYYDPSVQEPDFSDSKFFFITKDMKKDEYKAEYPDSKLGKTEEWSDIGDPTMTWVHADTCRIAEWFYLENKKQKIWLLDDKSVVMDEDLQRDTKNKDLRLAPEGRTLVGSRDTLIPTVKWKLINGIEVLEETDWMGKYIPIVPVIGDEIDVDGQTTYEGIVRHARDSQRMYNYWASAETEIIALAPKAPWIGVEGQFAGMEDKWRVANKKNFAYLEYKLVQLDGKPAPPPARNIEEPPVRAITQARELAGQDMQSTTGTFDPALGKEGNETSGRAILARQSKHGMTNFHYGDNMAIAIRYLARIIIDLVPKIYDSERLIRIVHPDGTSEQVQVNKTFKDAEGVERIYDLKTGKYDTVVSSGPSYNTKRQETVATMMALAAAWPQIVEIAGDLMVKNMDWAGANEIAARLKKMLPPALQDGSDISPTAARQITQLRGAVQQLTGMLQKVTQKMEGKIIDTQSKERIALNKNLTDLVMAAEQYDHEKSTVAFTTLVEHINQQLDNVGEGQNPGAAAQASVKAALPQPAQPAQGNGGDGQSSLPQSPQMGQTSQ